MTAPAQRGIDAVTIEVIQHSYLSVAEQMRRTLIRTAFNPGIYEILDFGISLYDVDLRLVAEASGIASFLGANDLALEKGLEYLGPDALEPGDIVLLNYPYWSSAHTYDAVLFAPIFAPDGPRGQVDELVGYTVIRAHWRDLGAKDPGYVLDSTSIHQEGLIFPGTKIVKRGKADHELLELIRFNSRMPEVVIGDLNAQISSIRVGERGVREVYAKYGRQLIRSAIDEVVAHGERQARKALATLPKGSWTARGIVDDDGITEDPVDIVVTVTIDEDTFTIDFTGSAVQQPGPINMPYGATVAIGKYIFKALTSATEPANTGHYAPLRIVAPPGTIFHAVYPAATFTLWTHFVATEVIREAVAMGIPEIGAAGAGDEPGFMTVVRDPVTDKLFVVADLEGIGWGATPEHDGATAQQNPCETVGRNLPVEVLEYKTGLVHECLELRTDSGGAGRFRGGLGIRRVVRATRPAEVLSMKKNTLTPPPGIDGGLPGARNGFVAYPGTDRERVLRMRRTGLAVGDRFENLSGGGGGCGNPLDRDVERVLDDVLDGYVSLEAAQRLYGVVVDGDRVVDVTDARALRLAEQASRGAREAASTHSVSRKIEE